jgi:hypothetical protein
MPGIGGLLREAGLKTPREPVLQVGFMRGGDVRGLQWQ